MDEKENKKIEEENVEGGMAVEEAGITIADDAVAIIAGKAVSEVEGISSMSGGFAGGITEVLSGKKNLAKGIRVESEGKNVKIAVNIIVEYGTRIPDVAFEIQNRVKKNVETMTGLKVVEVNVHVQGIHTEDEPEGTKE